MAQLMTVRQMERELWEGYERERTIYEALGAATTPEETVDVVLTMLPELAHMTPPELRAAVAVDKATSACSTLMLDMANARLSGDEVAAAAAIGAWDGAMGEVRRVRAAYRSLEPGIAARMAAHQQRMAAEDEGAAL